jgi:hypothetical protein
MEMEDYPRTISEFESRGRLPGVLGAIALARGIPVPEMREYNGEFRP